MRAKSIHVFDDLLSEELLASVQNYFAKEIRWQYGWPQGVKDPFSHWNYDFVGTGFRNQVDVQDKLYGAPEFKPVADIWSVLKEGPMHGHILVRCYANAHTFGVEGYPHTDVGDKSQIDNYTSVLYLNPVWRADWAGELVFFDDAGDVFFAVAPRPGRVAILPGELVHAARAVSRTCPAIRVCLAFKSRIPS
jgi:hypothetical protein